MSCFYAKNASFDMDKYLSALTIADFELSDSTDQDYFNGYNPQGTTLNQELISRIETLDGLEGQGSLYSHQLEWKLNEQTIKNLKSFCASDLFSYLEGFSPDVTQALESAVKEQKADAVIYGLDGIPLETITQKQYILDGRYDEKEFATGNYVLALGPALEKEDLADGTAMPTASVGDSILLEGKQYTVMAVVYPVHSIEYGALETGAGNGFNFGYIIPADIFHRQWPENTMRKMFFNVKDKKIEAAQQMIDSYTAEQDTSLPVTSRKTMMDQYKEETRASAVMGNAISIIIAMVGILNFANSMVTAIISRRKEFAMIQSVGMTKRQLSRMLMIEGLYYAGLTLGISYIASAIGINTVIRSMIEGGYYTFQFTLLPLILCTPFLIILAIVIPYICFRNLEKQSIVERLRAID